MYENGLLFQHHYFFDDKFLVNNESLQIHKRSYNERFFKTVLHLEFSLPFKILNTCWPCNLHNLAHIVGQRTVLDYTIVYDEVVL